MISECKIADVVIINAAESQSQTFIQSTHQSSRLFITLSLLSLTSEICMKMCDHLILEQYKSTITTKNSSLQTVLQFSGTVHFNRTSTSHQT